MRRYFPDGVSLQSIARAPALRYSSHDDLQTQWMQQVLGGSVPHNYHILPSSPGFVAACTRGVGWGMNPALMVDRHIASGDLVEIIPNKVLQKPLYWHCSRLIAAPISRLTLRIIKAGQKHLDQMR